MTLGKIKKLFRKTIGYDAFLRVAILQKKLKPKIKTNKPVAFLFGFSDWKYQYIDAYLKDYKVVFFKENENFYYIVNEVSKYKEKVFMVWGYKDRPRVLSYAQKKNIPYYRMEDGFIRSVQLGTAKSTPISVCIDSQALYYDASQPSDLEDILNTYNFQADKVLMTRATNSMKRLKDLNISKYNNVSSKNVELIYGKKERKRILVIGQVEDDESIKRGCSKKMTNNDLVWLARLENPEAEIIYKPHPDVLAGKRAMQSNPHDVQHIAKVITEPLSLVDSLETIDHVYTITSLSGFEALLRGIKVTTIGAPFYSGWGLTDDRQKVTRRQRNLTIEEIFAAAYILYPKYMHPITKEFITVEQAIDTIKSMKDLEFHTFGNEHSKSHALLAGFTEDVSTCLKQIYINRFDSISVIKSEQEFKAILEKGHRVSLFQPKNTVENHSMKKVALENNIPIHSIDFGFVTYSASLNSDFIPLSIKPELDGEDQLISILNSYEFNPSQLKRAKNGLEKIVDNNITNISIVPVIEATLLKSEESSSKVLVLGKQEDYTSNKEFSNKDMIWIARMENPDAEILFKPHPYDLLNQGTKLDFSYSGLGHVAQLIDKPVNLGKLLESVKRVYTIDSEEGFEALVRKIPVITYGEPFYAGWGLTEDRGNVKDRKRKRTVEELFAAYYILVPKYFNPFTKEEISFEASLKLLSLIRKIENRKEFSTKTEKPIVTKNLAAATDNEVELPRVEIQQEQGSKIGVLSKGIKEIPNLQSFLDGELVFNPNERIEDLTFIAGWGMKPSAQKAIAFSEKYNIPYIALEDGFLRSVGLGVEGSPPLSICIDDVGIYYDATRPSRLENMLNSRGWESEGLLKSAEKAMSLIRENYLSKYNHAPMVDEEIFENNGRKRVLVVDQTLGDMSITLGLASQNRFKEMYQKAKQDNPDADVYIKSHPDVISGKKEGNLTKEDVDVTTQFIYDDCNPLSLLEHIDKVYVVTSQFGFEALLLGKEVHCFGMPFYAGWGVTKDVQKNERRKQVRTVEEIFAAAYLLYPRYINPETGQPGNIFDVIDYLASHRPQKF